MIWNICFTLACILVMVAIVTFILFSGKKEIRSKIKPLHIAMGCCFFVSLILCVPAFCAQYNFAADRLFAAVAMSFTKAIKVFGGDAIYDDIMTHFPEIPEKISSWYLGIVLIVQVLSPLCTISVLLSFLKNISSFAHYLYDFKKDTYVFSALNAKSFALAKSIRENDKKSIFVFTDIVENENATDADLIKEVRKLGAICFSKDILAIDFSRHSKKKKLIFIMIKDNDVINTEQGLKIIEKYRDRENTDMFVMTTKVESEMLLSSADKGKMRVRRISETASLINRVFYNNEMNIFDNAIDTGEEEKLVSALVVGMGSHGTETVKTLSWFCQMDGYRIEINAFDSDELAKEKFCAKAPELMSDKYNGTDIPGEAHYKINIHSGINVETSSFCEAVREIKNISYVLVSLGDDELNIKTAVELRILFEQMGINPYIHAIVYSSERCRALKDLSNFKKQSYNINFIGDLASSYSTDVIFGSELEKLALKCHFGWGGNEDDFWSYEYNYRSSMAAAMHIKARRECKIACADKDINQMTQDEILALGYLEHRRWNAYMRSQGFIYSGDTHIDSRNDLGRMHHNLVPNGVLDPENYKKDLIVSLN